MEASLGASATPDDLETLAQGEDPVNVTLNLVQDSVGTRKETTLTCTWDKLLSYFGPNMLAECTDEEMMARVKLAYYHAIPAGIRKYTSTKVLVLPFVVEDKIRVQFQALGYITQGSKKRAVADKARYWRLTPQGEKHMLSVRAVRRTQA